MKTPYDVIVTAYRQFCDVLRENAAAALDFTPEWAVLMLIQQLCLNTETKATATAMLIEEYPDRLAIILPNMIRSCPGLRREILAAFRKELEKAEATAV